MNVLILGATGFIGSNFLKKFSKKKINITAVYFKRDPWLNKKNINWIRGDLRNQSFCNKILKDQDLVIQAAATTSGAKDIINKPYIHVTDNAVMNAYLIQSCFDNKVKKFIFFSCTVIYQNSKKPLREIDFNPKKKLYEKYFGVASTKLYIEKLCEFYSKFKRVKFTVIRHSNVYGPHDKYDLEKSHFFGATITKVINAKNQITVWGKGKEKRDMLYVDDLITFVEKCIKKQKQYYEIYNCGSGKAEPIINIIKKIIKYSKKKINIKYDLTKPIIDTSLCLDCSKAKKELSWLPKNNLNNGIKKTIKWYKKNF
jgi:nucleoside-diphosphate-sugar epimerase